MMIEGEDGDLDDDLDQHGGAPDGDDDQQLTVEERARLRGWKPLDEYHGDPRRWRDAETFVRVGDEDSRIAREENRRFEQQLHRQGNQLTENNRTIEELKLTVREMVGLAKKADLRGYQRARAELVAQRDAAVESGDVPTFKQIDDAVKEMDRDHAEAVQPPERTPTPTPAPVVDPRIEAWRQANETWFGRDVILQRAMLAHLDIVQSKFPAVDLDEQLARAKKRVIDEYPERFPGMTRTPAPPPAADDDDDDQAPAPRARRAPAVATPSAQPQRRPRHAAGWDQIEDPDERRMAKGAYDRAKRADPQLTEDEYLAIYINPHLDVIDMRQARSAAR